LETESCLEYSKYFWKDNLTPVANREWMSNRLMALLHRLLSISPISHDDRNESVRYALGVLLSSLVFSFAREAWRWGQLSIGWLKTVINGEESTSRHAKIYRIGASSGHSFTSCWAEEHADVLKWILLIGAAAAAQINQGSDEWLTSRISILMGQDSLIEAELVKAVKPYIYIGPFHYWS
jgi:hypothetical protein